MKEGDCENGSTRKGTLGDLCGKVHHPSVPEIHIVIIKQELFKKITGDGRSTSVFSLYGQISQGQMANFPAFIASKSFDQWNHHIPQMKWYNFWHILMYQKYMKLKKKDLKFFYCTKMYRKLCHFIRGI